ncbi:GMC family oxidoreductase [Thioclava sp. 15-R06ZXC-3]|uniref:GMC family oxidoreductase n=1 Tax=Thioclava arctica TaxID=3238301 RepID=A0ABV3TNC9_9RHOB
MGLITGHDAVVVGSGAGGAAAAWRLCQHGLRVLLLEAGPTFDPARDYPLDSPGWERKGFPVRPGSQASITYGDLGTLHADSEDLASWSRGGFPWRLPAGSPRPPSSSGYSHVQGVGGSTLHFVGEAHRLHPDAFRQHSLTGSGTDWPLGYADLEPLYTEVEDVLGVAGADTNDERWRSRPYPLPPHPLSPGALALQQAGSRLGQSWQVNPRAALSAPWKGRPPCNYCGQCSRGCPLGDKGSADVTFLPQADETGRLTLLPNSIVTRLHTGPNGRIVRIDAIVAGRRESIETPILVLAAGAVQTPRLLLLSANAEMPDGVANSSGQVGRNFMETLSWRSVGFVPGLTGSHLGLPADAICWTPSQADARVADFRLNHTTLETGLNGPIGYATRLVPGFGAEFKAALRESFGSALAVGAVGRVVPDARSGIDLDPLQRDAHGLPVARISSVLTEQSVTRLRQMAKAARAVLAEAGAVLVEEAGSRDSFTATHVFGTARMGSDRTTSVADPLGRAHDHPNLWIADASTFPTSGGGEAPSLTIMALALRAADAIASQ